MAIANVVLPLHVHVGALLERQVLNSSADLSLYVGAQTKRITADGKIWLSDPTAVGVPDGVTAVTRANGGWWRWQFDTQEISVDGVADGQLIPHKLNTMSLRVVVFDINDQVDTTLQVVVPTGNQNQIQLFGIDGSFSGTLRLSRKTSFR